MQPRRENLEFTCRDGHLRQRQHSFCFPATSPSFLHGSRLRRHRIRREIVRALVQTLWVTAWADSETAAGRTYPGRELFDVAPKPPGDLWAIGQMLAREIERCNQSDLADLYIAATHHTSNSARRTVPEEFGHCLAMEALGSGVRWEDHHPAHGFRIPMIELQLTGACLKYSAERVDP